MRQLPDSLGLDDVVKDTVAEIGKAYAEFAAKQALASASEVLRDLAADTAGILMGAVCKALLQVILRREAAITAKLDSLIREPALTGINVGFEAFNGSTVEADAAEFRQRRLQFAIERLDVAAPCPAGPKTPNSCWSVCCRDYFSPRFGADLLWRASASRRWFRSCRIGPRPCPRRSHLCAVALLKRTGRRTLSSRSRTAMEKMRWMFLYIPQHTAGRRAYCEPLQSSMIRNASSCSKGWIGSGK